MSSDDKETNQEMPKTKFLGNQIEELKSQNPSLSYIECTVAICEKLNIEIETLKGALPKAIKEKIESEALELNLLKYKINTVT